MSIYIITLLICLIISMIAYQTVYVQPMNNYKCLDLNHRYKRLFIILAVFMLLVVGLRADVIGIDTLNYKDTFYAIGRRDFSFLNSYEWYQESGYAFVIILFNKLGFSWQAYAVFMAALFIIPMMVLIFKNTDNCFLALTIFIMCGLWTYPMSTMRQAAAIGLTVIAFMFEDKKRNLLCLLFIFLASLFHISALLALVYFVVRKVSVTKRGLLVWFVAGILIVVIGIGSLRNILAEVMISLGRDYQNNDLTGGLRQELFYIASLGIGWFFGQEGDERYWKYYMPIFLSAVLLPIVRINPALFRIYAYFSIYEVVFIPLMLSKVNQKMIKVVGYMGYFGVYLYLFFTQSVASSLKVTPYMFFWM